MGVQGNLAAMASGKTARRGVTKGAPPAAAQGTTARSATAA